MTAWSVLTLLLAIPIGSSIVFYLLALACTASFRRRPVAAPAAAGAAPFAPPVSVLKPVKGLDTEAEENFESFLRQDYPDYEIVFGVADREDPVVPWIRRLQRAHPDRAIKLVFSGERLGANEKVSNLAWMLAEARHEIVVISDSDMRVQPDYLAHLVAPLADEQVGLTTCLYRGFGATGIPGGMESLIINADFIPAVLVALKLEGLSFALGATMATRKSNLEAIGGLRAIVNHLADDYELGNRIWKTGKRIELVNHTIDDLVRRDRWEVFAGRQLRWMKTYRICRPGGFLGLLLTYGSTFALFLALANWSAPWAWQVAGATWTLRVLTAFLTVRLYTGDAGTLRWFWLLPAKDLFTFAAWCASFIGDRVTWRGITYRLHPGGTLEPLGAAPAATAPPLPLPGAASAPAGPSGAALAPAPLPAAVDRS
ncbi:MAG: bacteriohopanetetrol glucosamine biosynthesis glycosyltransferase HpnI [Planctomycetes bacterium]|nr:bacteriohopanetetrol glucosamine biosynthesis glycosyltransferase HpnI [Planctomycetota bacterium]